MSKKGLFGVSLYRGAIKKKTSQGKRKGVKFSSMNKHRKRSFKYYNSQGR